MQKKRSIDFFPSSPFGWERLSMKLVKAFLKKSFTPPDASSDERCWPGGSFHRKAYALATSQR
jgi:hypothetical protein